MSSTRWEKAVLAAFKGRRWPSRPDVGRGCFQCQPDVLEWDGEKLQCATGRKAPWWQGEGGGGRIVWFRKLVFFFKRSALENDLV